MTLNFPRRPIFPANSSEDKLASSIRLANGFIVEGIPDNNGDGYGKPPDLISDSCDYGRDRTDRGGSGEPASNDILDLLPSDPFGMNVSATFTFRTDGLNLIWNRAMKFQAEPGNTEIYETSNSSAGSFDGLIKEKELTDGSCNSGFVSVCNFEEFVSFNSEGTRVGSRRTKEHEEGTGSCSAEDYGVAPHEGLLYALGYLGVQDLLSVERVCRSLRSAVQGDNLLWRSIHIDQPLSERICDDALLRLTNRAQGNLQCLSLVRCLGITNDGLKRVLERNPRLEKLGVPGCTRLSIEGIVNDLKDFKSLGARIKHLRIGGRYDVTDKHLEELKFLLSAEKVMQQPKAHKPRFYHNGYSSFSCDDDRDIDIEMCPRCQNLRLVYDCPAESCEGKQSASQLCRACTICIARCFMCGRCIIDNEYEETFCLDMLCSHCWNDLLLCQEEKGTSASKQTIFHQETRYQLRLCG
ncbi:F-box domain [Macleaya cordata]|uniref:F-box domain n=1 Tax=Macleaya cordata TaxID=56857 RepID=A0A200R4D4_MACCD|nr:F-box domain [Macleaya cordata]